ncbi:hypothetical protein NADFUDRAFT_81351 [Nadsonia fulvescens var. elongata DSM 6958]|uniref:Uncharacterized protein n=1 Tax=Nadsonia fulvescens var. elongata DSM 6958 TaxID=857566 RepID=A0A1E3PU42_9ASCO|nr:hypothetical protein NADFUDRAFT_81351 [Nadsonia fulvescens var. elongata DSM 6958]
MPSSNNNENHMTPAAFIPNSTPINIPAPGPIEPPKRRGSLLDSLFSFGKSPTMGSVPSCNSGPLTSPPASSGTKKAIVGSSITADEALNLSRSLNGRKPSSVGSHLAGDSAAALHASPLTATSTAAAVLAHYPKSPTNNSLPLSQLSAQLNNNSTSNNNNNHDPALAGNANQNQNLSSVPKSSTLAIPTTADATPVPDQATSSRRNSFKAGRRQSTTGKSLQAVGLVAAFGGGVGDY